MRSNSMLGFRDVVANLTTAPSGCLLWNRRVYESGYGYYKIRNQRYLAHRLVWIMFHGDIPEGACVLHKCDIPHCVKADHLFLGTRQDNNRDRMVKGRSAVGEKSGRAKLTEYEVRQIRRLYRRKGETTISLGLLFGVSNHQISMIVRRRSWSHLI